MKILNLKFQAFGPFAKEQNIDFTKLNNKGIFWIKGPTGVGKTTIFDSIVYGFYGKGSGKDRDDPKSLRSDHASENDKTYVELTFEANGKIYRITRTAGYNRQSRRGGGTTFVQPAVELIMPDGQVITKSKDVDDMIVNNILFIDRDQFKNIALLAQGEFTELITASSTKRAGILEHIFKKEIYQDFQDKIGEYRINAQSKLNASVSSVNTLIKQVEDGENISGYEQALQDPSNINVFIESAEKVLSDKETEKNNNHPAVEKASLEHEEALSNLMVAQQNNQQIKNYLNAVKEKADLDEKKPTIEKLRASMEEQIEINNLKPLINNKNQFESDLRDAKSKLNNATKELETVDANEKWLKENKQKRDEAEKEANELSAEIKNLNALKTKQAELFVLAEEYEKTDKDFSFKFEQFQKDEANYQSIRSKYFASISHNLAQQLEEGVPCPVCGSTSHPSPVKSVNPVSEDDFNIAEKDHNKSNKDINDEKNKLTQAKTRVEESELSLINALKENGFPGANNDFVYKVEINNLISTKKDEQNQQSSFVKNYDEKSVNVKTSKATFEQQKNNAQTSIHTAQSRININDGNIENALKANKIVKTLEDYFEHVGSKDGKPKLQFNVEGLREQIQKYESKVTANNAVIENTSEELKKAGMVDESSLVEDEKNKRELEKTLKNAENELTNSINNLKSIIKSIKDEYQKCKNDIDYYSSLQDLYKAANGSNNKKIDFKMYVLADYFDKIIIQANKRLSRISNGRYKLIRRTEIKGSARQGLDLDVYDVETGKNRPASSLSGGEKFVAALSMALGLSDIIETSHALVQVESIFIDEGFGTLDDDYIDTAMKALESLKSENKTIAIISHVEKLRSYIPALIEVKKDDVGSVIIMKDEI